VIDWDALARANAPLNAFTDFDRSATGGTGALAGLTVGVKANIMAKGLPWTAGMELFRNRIADRDAEVVARLRAEGAAIIGSLNMEEAALGSKTDNPWFGATQNPHRPGYTPGGSSGGSGAAVAAGLCDIALGSDTLGSIRIPAAHCGIYGFKPATSRVSQDGLEPADLAFDAIGPLARDLDILEKAARIISEFGEDDIAGPGATLAGYGVAKHPDIVSAFAKAVDALPTPPVAVHLDWVSDRIRFAGFIHVARAMDAHLRFADPAKLSANLQRLVSYGPRRKQADWEDDKTVLEDVRSAVRAIVDAHGFIILPTAPNPPFSHHEDEPAGQADLTCLASIAGLPALALPMGWTGDGLPLGVQLVGPEGKEAGLFALARRLDAALAAYRPPANFGY
jgi:aspartyl-tRNA(Asn)/glutamyl-tRNA(Gln) amidotransferase subunit A